VASITIRLASAWRHADAKRLFKNRHTNPKR
jgi:hypothetical protein